MAGAHVEVVRPGSSVRADPAAVFVDIAVVAAVTARSKHPPS
jgi:hypothetical protein